MATQTTTTFLELVNSTIDEAGEDLASFAVDGSDFTTQTDAMMGRFKKWVQRAWRTLQQECFDWEWMQEQAVVNIVPGIMFYSDSPVGFGTAAINPAVIVDVDDTVVVSGLTVDGVQRLTGVATDEENFGYMDIRYSDYEVGSSHVLDFRLKAGGERLTREGSSKLKLRVTLKSAVPSGLAVGMTVSSVDALDLANAAQTNFPLFEGSIVALTQDAQLTTIDVEYTSMTGNFWSQMQTYAAAQASTAAFNIAFTLHITDGVGSYNTSGAIRFPVNISVDRPDASITPLLYKIEFDGNVETGTGVAAGNVVNRVGLIIDQNGVNIVNYFDVVEAIIDGVFENASAGVLQLSVNDDGGLGEAHFGASSINTQCLSLFTYLLFASCVPIQTHISGIIFECTNGLGGTVGLTNGASEITTWTFTYTLPYLINNYVHSWKSFNWDEELGVDDFVENIRDVNQRTFKVIRHDDPAPVGDLPLQYIPWGSFQNVYDFPSLRPGLPRLVTEDNTGRWRFYPPIDRPYTVTFNYGRQAQELVDFDDVPKGIPQEYVDMIMWRALQYYGEYDEQPSVANRGKGNYKNILMAFEQQTRPKFYFKAKQLW